VRGMRKTIVGKVSGDKMDRTISVRVERRVSHPIYDKIQRRWTNLQVHDEKNEGRVGDLVEIMETRPLSKTKRWRLVKVVKRTAEVS